MGRYTTVQIYSDSNPSMRSVSYNQSTDTTKTASTASTASTSAATPHETKRLIRPEKVDNPSGSTAGAGSGEFHVYRAARARETLRLKTLDEEEKERLEQEQFQKQVWENMSKEQKKTEKRRKKRLREKNAKLRKKNMKLNGIVLDSTAETTTTSNKKNEKDLEDEEFQYTPIYVKNEDTNENSAKKQKTELNIKPEEIKNDGSFLELMKKKMGDMAESQQASN